MRISTSNTIQVVGFLKCKDPQSGCIIYMVYNKIWGIIEDLLPHFLQIISLILFVFS